MRNNNSFTKTFFLMIVFVSLFILKAKAIGPMIINEIMYDLEGADNDMEWIELKNISNEPIDLTGWKFNDGSNHLLNIPPKNGGQGTMIIQPQGFVVLADKADLFLQNHPNFLGTVIDTTMALNNTAATLKLIDNNGNIVEEVSYNKTQGGDGNGFSLERVSDSVSDFCESNIYGGTPGQENNFNCHKIIEKNSSPTPQTNVQNYNSITPLPTVIVQIEKNKEDENNTTSPAIANPVKVRIIINEFLPNPIGNDQEGEWVEIYNDSEIDLPLKGWRLEDKSGQKYYFKDEIIKQKDFLVLPYRTTKINLNNNGETISLYAPNDELAFKIGYVGNAKEGFSYARLGPNSWQWTPILTPGKPNQFEIAQSNKQKDFNIDSIVEDGSDNNQIGIASSTPQNNIYAQNKTNNFADRIILVIVSVGIIFSIASAIFIKKILP